MDKLYFSKRLRELMTDLRLTQAELSNIIGVRQSQISNWLAGKSFPGYCSLQIIKEKFNLLSEELI
ncbi:MAG: helix-turn-helix domain-containing protein [Christensenellaceae bacterium]|nr:helix-turn-helix domain-containing protein [Christensenellaceae bacterium]